MAFDKNELIFQNQLQYAVMYIRKYREPRHLGCTSYAKESQEMAAR